ncbi:MAG: hypothetical protein WKF84_26715 [Pyrinomonadaceae bacterium]
MLLTQLDAALIELSSSAMLAVAVPILPTTTPAAKLASAAASVERSVCGERGRQA